MDVKFDAAAAERLLQQMDVYCTGIQKEAKALLATMKDSDQWNDKQKQAFQANIFDLAKDLNQALLFESDYMRTFYQRVQELRG